MDLAPGPFVPGTKADVTVEQGSYDFIDDAQALSDELTAIAAGWDPFISDLPLAAADIEDLVLYIDDIGLMDEIANQSALASFPEIDVLADALGVSTTLFSAAYAFAPAAAFTVPTGQFNPPDPTAKIVAPLIPVSAYTGGVQGLETPPVTTTGNLVTLRNTTRVGQQNFVVGDSFSLTATGPPNSPVTVSGSQNGIPFAEWTVGTTDAVGVFETTGTEGPDAVGQWIENWSIGGQLVATFQFLVTPSGE